MGDVNRTGGFQLGGASGWDSVVGVNLIAEKESGKIV